MGGSERTSQSDDERVDGSTVKEIEQRDVACTFVAGVTMMIFRQNGNSHIHTHTHLTAFFRDYPGEPVSER